MRRPIEIAHGVTEREQQILDALDSGMGFDAVAARFGMNRERVKKIGKIYSNSWANSDDFESMVRKGTIALARACAASGGRFA